MVWFLIGGVSVLDSFRYHASRGLGVETVYAGAVLAWGQLAGIDVPWVFEHKAAHLAPEWGSSLAALAAPLQAVALLLVVVQFWRSGMTDGMRYAAAAVLATLVTSKVLSPQYLIWLFPFLSVLDGWTGSRVRWLFLFCCVITAMIYPGPAFAQILDHQGGAAVLVLNLRNVLLLVLVALSCSDQRRERPRGLGQARESPWPAPDSTGSPMDMSWQARRSHRGRRTARIPRERSHGFDGIRIGDAMATGASPIVDPSTELSARGKPYLGLFLIRFLILFFELTCIRWIGSMVIFAFFTNLVLMASFLGMSVGCMAASRKENYINAVLPLALVSVGLSVGSLLVFTKLADRVGVDVGRQGSPQEIFFGTEPPRRALLQINVPIELIAGVFSVLIALMFVGLGQEMGRKFNALPDRVWAYTTNILGSLAGIVVFGIASYSRTTPLHWFAVSLMLCALLAEAQSPAGREPGRVAAGGWRRLVPRRGVVEGHLVAVLQGRVQPAHRRPDHEQHRPSDDEEKPGDRLGLRLAAPPEPRRRGQAVRGRPDHRRRVGQRRASGPGAGGQARRRRRDRAGLE